MLFNGKIDHFNFINIDSFSWDNKKNAQWVGTIASWEFVYNASNANWATSWG